MDIAATTDSDLLRSRLSNHFGDQLLMVLATHDGAAPYTSLVAFAAAADLGRLVFATSRATRKFSNIEANGQVSALIDNRTNRSADFAAALAVTVLGQARELAGEGREAALTLLLQRHPEFEPFCRKPSTALIEIRVRRYILVDRFEEVRLLDMAGSG